MPTPKVVGRWHKAPQYRGAGSRAANAKIVAALIRFSCTQGERMRMRMTRDARTLLQRANVYVDRSMFGLQIERRPVRMRTDTVAGFHVVWRDWIDARIAEFARIYAENRAVQREVGTWIDRDALGNSLWRYGLTRAGQDFEIEEINAVNRTITYTDLIALFAGLLPEPRYLEIGVSSGKNFYQVVRHLRNTVAAGLDIEEMNPRLAELLPPSARMWESEASAPFTRIDGRAVQKTCTLTEHHDQARGNTILYLSGDKFTAEPWRRLSGQHFNVIFSDACHMPASLQTEVDFLVEFDVIDQGQFVMIWDDLGGEMTDAFFRATDKLVERCGDDTSYRALVEIPGTYGGGQAGSRLHFVGLLCQHLPGAPTRPKDVIS